MILGEKKMIIPNMLLLALDDEAHKRVRAVTGRGNVVSGWDSAVSGRYGAATGLDKAVASRYGAATGWDKAVTGQYDAHGQNCAVSGRYNAIPARGSTAQEEYCSAECCCEKQPCCQAG
jgi:hypothetical protein